MVLGVHIHNATMVIGGSLQAMSLSVVYTKIRARNALEMRGGSWHVCLAGVGWEEVVGRGGDREICKIKCRISELQDPFICAGVPVTFWPVFWS